ncbi:hypothetical protein ES288_D01G199100v1 [Gossypium darwinii]|uniref:Uncharacterized protein n=1 Tax=Gossypium darwinii TaxID=34276 RepID=A0A5D2DRX2_GOSDA|nr:hypothetical protein ES288_D01G199100v1 [Gossypium darwinii]
MDPPKTPLSVMQPRPPTSFSIPSKLTVNFVLLYAAEIVEMNIFMLFSGRRQNVKPLFFIFTEIMLVVFSIECNANYFYFVFSVGLYDCEFVGNALKNAVTLITSVLKILE